MSQAFPEAVVRAKQCKSPHVALRRCLGGTAQLSGFLLQPLQSHRKSSEEYPFVHVCSFTGFLASSCTTNWQHWNIPRLHWNALKLSVKLSWAFASFASFAFVAFSGRGSRGFASNLVIPSQNTSLAHVTYWHKLIMCSSIFSHVISVLPFDITIRGQLTSDFVDKSVWHSFSSGWTALVWTIYRTPLVK